MRGTFTADAPDFAEIGLDAAGRVCHALIVGREPEREALRRLVEERADVAGREESLRNPMVPL